MGKSIEMSKLVDSGRGTESAREESGTLGIGVHCVP